MADARLGLVRAGLVAGVAALAIGPGLAGSARLSYHEAFVAQSAREMIASGDALVPTIDGRPWLEKPPLACWLVAGLGRLSGQVGAFEARLPSAVAAGALALGLAVLVARRSGPDAGLLAGAVQATVGWAVARGRLAEADILLACLVTWSFAAFDRLRPSTAESPISTGWRWAFFALLGLTSLAKGIGFGAALLAAGAVATWAWDRDRRLLRALAWPVGWALSALIALAWPALVLARHPEALGLWTLHVADRLADRPEHFAGSSPWWFYGPMALGLALPWTPLAIAGAWRSARRAAGPGGRGGVDRLLWAWAVAPLVLLSTASVKNGHYAIHTMPPWSAWAALGLIGLGGRLARRGWSPSRVRRAAAWAFGALALAYGLGHAGLGPRYDRRGLEWAFYEAAGRSLGADEPLALLYDDWDRDPYPTPFGPVPHDLAVRLFYLDRPAAWRANPAALASQPVARAGSPFGVIARERDLPDLLQLGRIEALARGPSTRWDRTFALYRVRPGAVAVANRRLVPGP